MRQMNVMRIPVASADAAAKYRIWTLGPSVPQTRGGAMRRVGWWWMQRMGWTFEGSMPDLPKFVVIVAPHTSNWDFIIGLAAKWALGLDVRWLGKHSLFFPPLGWFMRAVGGVPTYRDSRQNVVEQSVGEFATREHFVLVLAPEGTRRRVSEWRSGFWHVAKRAGVPICLVAFDWGRRVVRLGPTTTADEDEASDGIARIRSYYDDVHGYDPSRQG
ncbi:MAG: lysophospholipid acyltransferase family protein [Gemmatimonas sp.]